MQCRWCGVGGDLVGCESCPKSFCRECIVRNLGQKEMDHILTLDPWACFVCDDAPVKHLPYQKHLHVRPPRPASRLCARVAPPPL